MKDDITMEIPLPQGPNAPQRPGTARGNGATATFWSFLLRSSISGRATTTCCFSSRCLVVCRFQVHRRDHPQFLRWRTRSRWRSRRSTSSTCRAGSRSRRLRLSTCSWAWRILPPAGRGAGRRLDADLAFGLIHGFGFSASWKLRELGVGENGTSIVMLLFTFNAGVEVGQDTHRRDRLADRGGGCGSTKNSSALRRAPRSAIASAAVSIGFWSGRFLA